MNQANTIWRIATPKPLIRCWEGECVVFNPLGGDTHLVSALLARLIQVLGERDALDLTQLTMDLRPLFDADNDDADCADQIQGMLFALEQQYLVFRVTD